MKEWVKLDNASNIFLAARSDLDTKVFRLTANMDHAVDPFVLQKALDQTLEKFILYSSVLRRGFFWYYLQQSDLKAFVKEETEIPCAQIYHYDRRELLYRVLYYENRIHCEFFHALSDGTGALWFFRDLVINYSLILHPEHEKAVRGADPFKKKQFYEDSFYDHFDHKKESDYIKSARSALYHFSKGAKKIAKPFLSQSPRTNRKVLHIRGKYTPDHRMNIVEMIVPVKKTLEISRGYRVSMTIFLTALFMESAYSIYGKDKNISLRISVPVNLRQFFPSNSARNFFYTAKISYPFTKDYNFEDLCRSLKGQLIQQTRIDYIEEKVRKLVQSENIPIGRVLLRPIKDFALRQINRLNNRGLTLSMSNLGKLDIPEELREHIIDAGFLTATVRPQFCMISYGDRLTITFTSPFVERKIERDFAEKLRKFDIPITIRANELYD